MFRIPVLKLSSGALFTSIGWLLTADAVLGAFAFIAVWQSVAEFGGRYPPALIYFLMFPLLAAGGSLTFYGARLLRQPRGTLVLLFPTAAAILLLSMLQFLACVPWTQCVTP